jgi:hypothetical protein
VKDHERRHVDALEEVRVQVIQARLHVREYAILHTPGVDPDFLQAIIAAVGDISVTEAIAALEMWGKDTDDNAEGG